MSHIYKTCASCHRVTGFYTCPGCGMPFCFDHCIGHGCKSQSSTPTVVVKPIKPDAKPDIKPEADPKSLFRPWLWERLHLALHAVGSLDLYDEHFTFRLTLSAPVIGSSLTGYTYVIRHAYTRPWRGPTTTSLEDLIHAMPAEHQRLLYTLLGLFVERARAGKGQQDAGHIVRELHADALPCDETLPLERWRQNIARTVPR
jgi:hypothetical protein